jgi:hypothetical protein
MRRTYDSTAASAGEFARPASGNQSDVVHAREGVDA